MSKRLKLALLFTGIIEVLLAVGIGAFAENYLNRNPFFIAGSFVLFLFGMLDIITSQK